MQSVYMPTVRKRYRYNDVGIYARLLYTAGECDTRRLCETVVLRFVNPAAYKTQYYSTRVHGFETINSAYRT